MSTTYIRSKDMSNIVERPERLRAVSVGLSAAIARLEELFSSPTTAAAKAEFDPNDLAEVMNKLKLDSSLPAVSRSPVAIVQSQASVNILSHPAVKFLHGDIEGDVYLENLAKWIKQSPDKVTKGESEITEGYSQGDLYHTQTPLHRAFVAIRPPGHHCGEDTPSGFCFLTNVAIGAAYAHLQHGIKRILIFDIYLHHGNGTQSIVWQINEETYRQTLESEGGGPTSKTGPQIYYGSIHNSVPHPFRSTNHMEYIENIHLQTYTSEQHFWDVLYKEKYSKLLDKARAFLDDTGGPGDDVLVFVSCGMDACEHEYESMSRHNRKVPTSFYHRFARDACALSDKYAKGRLVSVIEGAYSDRALTSGAMAHLSGLVDVPNETRVNEEWWSVENLVKLEGATKKRRGGRLSLPAQGSVEPWLERTLVFSNQLEGTAAQATGSMPRLGVAVPPSDRTLRDRTKGKNVTPGSSPSSNKIKPVSASAAASKAATVKPKAGSAIDRGVVTAGSGTDGYASTDSSPLSSPSSTEDEAPAAKKLPRVILKLGKPPEVPSSQVGL
ncbi:histone deacetylase domain-containing protein [Flammula alnicola]|nr:histone deacetylase domain-containing protein [Flammula alnicola]